MHFRSNLPAQLFQVGLFFARNLLAAFFFSLSINLRCAQVFPGLPVVCEQPVTSGWSGVWRKKLWRESNPILNRMLRSIEWLVWAPLGAASLHIFEEFVWPGSFLYWYRVYRGNAKSVNRGSLILINAGLLMTLLEACIGGHTSVGAAMLVTFSGILFSNGCWHLWATYKRHSYSPGTVTGVLLYLPLADYEFAVWFRSGGASLRMAIAAVSIGRHIPYGRRYITGGQRRRHRCTGSQQLGHSRRVLYGHWQRACNSKGSVTI